MTTTLADVLQNPGAHAPGGEPQSPPSDLTPSSPTGSSPGSDDGDGESRKRSASGSLKEGKERTANKICRVCGDKAYSYNFNVITCESCKAFFRRNANKEKEIRCPFNESCEINVVSRRFCQRCRLFKCFQVGMKKEWIMTDEARLEKKARVEENRPDLPTMTTSTATSNLLDALAHQVQHQQQQLQQQQQQAPPVAMTQVFQAATLPAAATAALVAAVAAPQQPTSSELVAHAIALEQQLQQTPFAPATPQTSSAATAAAVYQAAAVAHHHQQQQQMAANAAVQQILSMTAAPVVQPTFSDATMAAALAMPPQTPASTANAVAAALNAAAASASSLGPLTQAALIMDASAAATQQLLAAHAPPPPSALAAVASTMLLPPQQQHSLLQPTLPERCCCTCNCGKYHGGRSIVDQAQEEWEAEQRARRSNSSNMDNNDMGLADLLPGASSVNWLNPATNSNPLTEGSSIVTLQTPTMSVDEAYPEGTLQGMKDSFLRNPLLPPGGIKECYDPEFGPMEEADEMCMKFVHEANKVWEEQLDGHENKLHSQELPSKNVMLEMMVGAVNRMIKMAKKFPALKALHPTDQLKLLKSCYLDVMIIRGAMAYDPSENAWKGPTNKHGYKIKMDAMNDDPTADNMFHQSIRLYTMFKEEYRQNESVMLLLNMIILFDPNADGLTNVSAVRAEQNKYKRCLKRFMYTLLNSNQSRVQLEYKSLLERLATVRKMNSGARGIMEENADSMDPLLKELLGKDDDKPASKKHSPSGVSSVSSCASTDDLPTSSNGA